MQLEEVRELKIRKKDFLNIVKHLVESDAENIPEKSKYNQEGYKIRKLISELPASKMRISLLKLEEATFFVVVKYESLSGEIITSWIHEDDVYRERLLFSDNWEHISHKIVCMTDLYEVAEPVEKVEPKVKVQIDQNTA